MLFKDDTIQKAQNDPLQHNNTILYSPVNGQPITQEQWEQFKVTLQNLLNQHFQNTGEQLVLDAVTLGKVLNKMSALQTKEQIDKLTLEDLQLKNHSFDWIADSIKNLSTATGEHITDEQAARIQIAQQSACQRVTRISDDMRNKIQQVVIDGILNKESKSKISQNLFDTMQGDTRDFMRVADTEIQNNLNWANITSEVNKQPNKKVYFKRVEIIDKHTCPKCKAMNGKIALYTKGEADDIADLTIYEGDKNMGTLHPYCRGLWMAYEPPID